MIQRIILIEPEAPAKPVPGAPCNGCGLCCLHAPCPAGMLVSRRRQGACVALRWDAAQRRYLCGLLLPEHPRRGPRWWRAMVQALLRRWIAAGQGCDADLIVENIPQGRD